MFAGNGGSSSLVTAENADREDAGNVEDIAEGEEDEATVESDEGTVTPETPGSEAAATTDSEKVNKTRTESDEEEKKQKPKVDKTVPKRTRDDDEEEFKPLKASPNADTHILFTKPAGTDFPAGAPVRFLVGFTNKGDKDFLVDSMEASFRYPQDYSFYIQNFTTVKFDRNVEPKRQATFEYGFTPSETFNARPFGLTINLNYKDADGNLFQDAVFNDTVNITEPDEGLDGETFFLYVFLVAIAVLLLVGAQQFLVSFSKKRLSKPKQRVEMGTQNKGDVDYDWIPKENLEMNNKSPRRSPRTSPRQRRAKRGQGADD